MANSGFPYDVDPLETGQYDDAWQTQGWTSQNPIYPDHGAGLVPPDGITLVNVTGAYFSPEGKPFYGQLRFVPKTKSLGFETAQFVFGTEKAYVKRGKLDVQLPVPTYGGVFTYKVFQRVGPLHREFEITLSADNTTISLTAPVIPVEDNYYG